MNVTADELVNGAEASVKRSEGEHARESERDSVEVKWSFLRTPLTSQAYRHCKQGDRRSTLAQLVSTFSC